MKLSFTYKQTQPLMLMFLVAFSLRLLASFLLQSWISPNTFEYGAIAQNVLAGKGYSLPFIEPGIEIKDPFFSWMPPLYPILVTLFHWFFKNPYFWLLIFQCFISALTCLCIYNIAYRVFGYRTGMLAGFITAIYPLFILIPTKVLPSTLDIFLLSVIIISLFNVKESGKLSYPAITGILLGLFSLSQPQMFGFFPLIIFWLYLNKTQKLLQKGLIISLFILITITPWTARNYLIHNKLVVVSTNGGYNFWLGNNPTATGIAIKGSLEMLPSEVKDSLSTLSEIDFNSRLFRAGIFYIKSEPLRYLKLAAKKLYFFWFRPDLGLKKDQRRITFLSFYIIQNLFLFLMSIAGIVLTRNHWRSFSIAYLFIGYYSLIYMNFFFLSRFRWIVDPFLLILMSVFVQHIIERLPLCFPISKRD